MAIFASLLNVKGIGVDPGLCGALAFYFPPAPGRIAAEDIPVAGGSVDGANLAARIRQMGPAVAYVERAASRPGQGVASVFKFGAAYGILVFSRRLKFPRIWSRQESGKSTFG